MFLSGLEIAVGHSGRPGHWQLGWTETWWRRPVDAEVGDGADPMSVSDSVFRGTQVETEVQVVCWEHSTMRGSDAEQGLTAHCV